MLDVKVDRKKLLLGFTHVGVLLFQGLDLIHYLAAKSFQQEIVLFLRILTILVVLIFLWLRKQVFDVITEYIVELLNVHLDPNVDRVSVKFERLYETTGHEVGLLRFLEIGEDGLELVEHVVFDAFICVSVLVLIELDLEHMPPQVCAHEQLL